MPGQSAETTTLKSDGYAALFDQRVVGVGQTDPSGFILAANRCLEEMLGYGPGELVGLNIDALRHPDHRLESRQKLSRVVEQGSDYVLEQELVRKNGDLVWGAVNATAVRGAAGQVETVLAFVVDVTERKRVEQSTAFLSELSSQLGALRDERELLRAALRSIAEFFGAACALLVEVDQAEERALLSGYRLVAPPGPFTQRASFEPVSAAPWLLLRGPVSVVAAGEHEAVKLPFQLDRLEVSSYVAHALDRNDGQRVALVVVDERPRNFRPDEQSLLADALARLWPLVERSRAEAALEAELKAVEGLLVERHQSLAKRRAADDLVTHVTEVADRRHRLFETVLSSTPDLIHVFDLERRCIYANAAWLDAWGKSLNDVLGCTCLELGYPVWQARMHEAEIDQVVSTKQSIRGEVPFKGGQGERIHDYIFMPVLGPHGEVQAIAGTTRDVTVLKQAESLMAGQAQALELMVQGAPLFEVLDALCDVVDRQSPSQVRSSLMLMSDDGRELRQAAGRRMPSGFTRARDPWPVGPNSGSCGTAAFRGEEVISADIQHDPLWAEDRELALRYELGACWTTPIFSSGGLVLGTLSLYYPRQHQPGAYERRLVDIITRTAGVAIERKRGEEGLKTHSERLRLLWETAASLLITEDPEQLMRAVLGRIQPHMGLDVVIHYTIADDGEQLRLLFNDGMPEAELEPLRLLPADSPLFGGVTRSYEPFSAGELQAAPGPGLEPLAELGLSAYACFPLHADERLLGVLVVGSRSRLGFEVDELEFLRTITRYMTVAYERLRLVHELREADRKKDDFIALLAHELRNPLAPLRNGLHVMRLASHDSAAVARARAIMERQLSHMVRLIDDLLDISRISLNKLQLRRSRVLLSEIVANAVETARPAIDAAGHRLDLTVPSEPIWLDADLTRLAQVLSNLLTNAAKFTPKQGHIVLCAERQGDIVSLVVEDNGIGLKPESLRTIFGMFSQVDHSVERTAGGLGIGLALVRGLVEMHGGSVRADSAGPGLGSSFTVRLPVLPVAQITLEGPRAIESARPPNRRILIVDDNLDALESLATMLKLSGNEVHTAKDGIEAVEMAEKLRPDVVLMDIGMPRLNGRDATRRIRAESWGQGITVIALTGWGQEADRLASREAGMDAHLVKPVDYAELQRLMRELAGAGAQAQSTGQAKASAPPARGEDSSAGSSASS